MKYGAMGKERVINGWVLCLEEEREVWSNGQGMDEGLGSCLEEE